MNQPNNILKHPGCVGRVMLFATIAGCFLWPQLWSVAGEKKAGGLYDGPTIVSGDSLALTVIPEQMAEHLIASLRRTEPVGAPGELKPVRQAKTRGRELIAVYQKAAPAVVLIMVGGGKSSGTGFLINKDGWIVTNHHVVEGALLAENVTREVTVFFGKLNADNHMDAIDARFKAQVYKWDKDRDLALLKLTDSPFTSGNEPPFLKLADTSPPPGDDVVAIGHGAVSLSWSLKAGVVQAVGRNKLDTTEVFFDWEQLIHNSMNSALGNSFDAVQRAMKSRLGAQANVLLIQASCETFHGDSGAPLLNMNGEVVGVNAFSWPDKDNGSAHYFIHAKEVRSFLKDPSPSPVQTLLTVPNPWEVGATNCELEDLDHDGKPETVKFYTSTPSSGGWRQEAVAIGWDLAEESDLTKYIPKGSDFSQRNAAPRLDREAFYKDRAMRFQAYAVKVKVENKPCFYFAYDLNHDGHFEIVRFDRDGKGRVDIMWRSKGPGKPYQRIQLEQPKGEANIQPNVWFPASRIPERWRTRYQKVVIEPLEPKEETR